LTWAHKLRGRAHLVPADYAEDRVHTWVVTDGPLDEDTVFDYELTMGWHEWDTPARRVK
jgi:hypothetical protein